MEHIFSVFMLTNLRKKLVLSDALLYNAFIAPAVPAEGNRVNRVNAEVSTNALLFC